MKKVYVDGAAGTTGLRIVERLSARKDLEILKIPEELRKDLSARKEIMNQADVVFFCLPDDAAREAAGLVDNENTVIIDTSTAHRTDPDWTYGFPEIRGLREKIRTSKRIANPGCHASGVISLVAPLVEKGLLNPEANLTALSLTGYSGGGKKMIADYTSEDRSPLLDAPRTYGLTQHHKHLPEIVRLTGLRRQPAFLPVVGDFYSGMEVIVPVFSEDLRCTAEEAAELYRSYYGDGLVRYTENRDEAGFLSAGALSGSDRMELGVFGSEDRILLVSRFDNLGKGASGAAIQNMNLVLGAEETEGLVL